MVLEEVEVMVLHKLLEEEVELDKMQIKHLIKYNQMEVMD